MIVFLDRQLSNLESQAVRGSVATSLISLLCQFFYRNILYTPKEVGTSDLWGENNFELFDFYLKNSFKVFIMFHNVINKNIF